MGLDYDLEKGMEIISFINDSGESFTLRRNLDFDIGNIIISDTNKTINELMEGLNNTLIYFPPFNGIVCQMSNGDIIIKGWQSEQFVKYQIESAKNK